MAISAFFPCANPPRPATHTHTHTTTTTTTACHHTTLLSLGRGHTAGQAASLNEHVQSGEHAPQIEPRVNDGPRAAHGRAGRRRTSTNSGRPDRGTRTPSSRGDCVSATNVPATPQPPGRAPRPGTLAARASGRIAGRGCLSASLPRHSSCPRERAGAAPPPPSSRGLPTGSRGMDRRRPRRHA